MLVLAGARVTPQTAAVLSALLAAPEEGLYGRQIVEITNLKTGTVFPILGRLEHHGVIKVTEEDPKQTAAAGRRRPRCYYQIVPGMRPDAREAVAEVTQIWRGRLGLLGPEGQPT